MDRTSLIKSLSKIGYSVGVGITQLINNKGEELPIFINLSSINSDYSGGWSIVINYDGMQVQEMKDNNGNISAISLMDKLAKNTEEANTFLMFHKL